MTPQEIFNTVVTHIHKQGEPALSPEQDACQYLTADGRKCAVGCLLNEAELVSIGASSSPIQWLQKYLRPMFTDHEPLLKSLQTAHDTSTRDDKRWRQSFDQKVKRVADDYNLDASVIDTAEWKPLS